MTSRLGQAGANAGNAEGTSQETNLQGRGGTSLAHPKTILHSRDSSTCFLLTQPRDLCNPILVTVRRFQAGEGLTGPCHFASQHKTETHCCMAQHGKKNNSASSLGQLSSHSQPRLRMRLVGDIDATNDGILCQLLEPVGREGFHCISMGHGLWHE